MDDDDIARLRAQMDQAKEGAREFAGSLWAFHSALQEEGFQQDEAFTLTLQFLSSALSGGSSE